MEQFLGKVKIDPAVDGTPYHRVHESPSLVPVLSQINPVNTPLQTVFI